MCNVVIIFNLLNQIENQTTFKNIPFDSLSFVIDAIFSELKEMENLNLRAEQVRILKDILTHFPYMSYKACTCDRIIQGFVDVGVLDAEHKFGLIFM